MSVQATYIGNIAKPETLNLAGASLTDVFTATDDSLTEASFAFANDTAGTVTCYLYWYEAASSTDFMVWVGSVTTKTTQIVSDLPIRLRSGDKIKAVGAANVRVTVINLMNFALGR